MSNFVWCPEDDIQCPLLASTYTCIHINIHKEYKRRQMSKYNGNSWVRNFVVYLLTNVCGIALPDSYIKQSGCCWKERSWNAEEAGPLTPVIFMYLTWFYAALRVPYRVIQPFMCSTELCRVLHMSCRIRIQPCMYLTELRRTNGESQSFLHVIRYSAEEILGQLHLWTNFWKVFILFLKLKSMFLWRWVIRSYNDVRCSD